MPVDGAPLTRSGALRSVRTLSRYAGVRVPGLQLLRQLGQLIRLIQNLGGFTMLLMIIGDIMAAKVIIEGVTASQQYWAERRKQIEIEATRQAFYEALQNSNYERAMQLRAEYTRLTGGD